jgi:hypothetical protein
MGHLRYDLIMIPTGYFLMQFGYGKIIFIFQHRFYPNHLFLNYLNDPRNLTYGSLLVTKLICQRLATSLWFSPGPPVSSTYKTDLDDITEILLKVVFSTIKQTN